MSVVTEAVRTWMGDGLRVEPRVRWALGVLAFAAATAFGAFVAVPLPWTPVPMSLQPLFVILAGAVLGAGPGAIAMATYLAVGAAGAPVFALGGAGLPWLLGPTGGYLLAMPAAAYVVGRVVGGSRGWLRLLVGLTLGMLTLYIGGVSQLWILTQQDLGALVAVGVLPFLAGDVTKILGALLLARSVRSSSLGR
ncbi:MAG: biotin transporter BioY [Gemmatimonadetes bacterium]|nr:biotin transporter BioY [Gemmatimonadota bacterium]